MKLISKFTKKPVTIEAIQFADDADTISNISAFINAEEPLAVGWDNAGKAYLKIQTLEGVMTATEGDWIIKGVQGEFYPCKPDIFEKTYSRFAQSGLSFGQAIEALEGGHRVAREGWNGKGMFLFLLPASDGIPTKVIHDPALRAVIESEVGGDTFDALGSIRMFTADKKILTGWLASQTDILAKDWTILQ
jgi:hypothetical protein